MMGGCTGQHSEREHDFHDGCVTPLDNLKVRWHHDHHPLIVKAVTKAHIKFKGEGMKSLSHAGESRKALEEQMR